MKIHLNSAIWAYISCCFIKLWPQEVEFTVTWELPYLVSQTNYFLLIYKGYRQQPYKVGVIIHIFWMKNLGKERVNVKVLSLEGDRARIGTQTPLTQKARTLYIIPLGSYRVIPLGFLYSILGFFCINILIPLRYFSYSFFYIWVNATRLDFSRHWQSLLWAVPC